MTKIVLDTNVLVSALLSPDGSPAKVLDYCLNGKAIICYDSRIIIEYQNVLLREKFGFHKNDVKALIHYIIEVGISVVPLPIKDIFEDEEDKKFYEVAKACTAYLVTGNKKHFPKDNMILTPKEFLELV